jgi:hypothetical protein
MAILTCSQRELLQLTDISSLVYRQDKFRGQGVAAFGCEAPVLENRPLVLDAVACLVRDSLADQLPRTGEQHRNRAAAFTRNFWPEWAEAVAWVEHHRQPIVFALAEREDGQWWVAPGRADTLADYVRDEWKKSPLRTLVCVNVADILDNIDKRAAKHGLDLRTGSVILPPDDPNLVAWLAEFRQWRDAIKKFDPLHPKWPPRPNAAQRRAIEAISCTLH